MTLNLIPKDEKDEAVQPGHEREAEALARPEPFAPREWPPAALIVMMGAYGELMWKGTWPDVPLELVDPHTGDVWSARADHRTNAVRVSHNRHFYSRDESREVTEYQIPVEQIQAARI